MSLVGAAMSALYSAIAAAASAAAASGDVHRASYAPRPGSDAERMFSAASSIGTIMFAFGGHSVLLEIQARSHAGRAAHRDIHCGGCGYVAALGAAIC